MRQRDELLGEAHVAQRREDLLPPCARADQSRAELVGLAELEADVARGRAQRPAADVVREQLEDPAFLLREARPLAACEGAQRVTVNALRAFDLTLPGPPARCVREPDYLVEMPIEDLFKLRTQHLKENDASEPLPDTEPTIRDIQLDAAVGALRGMIISQEWKK